MDFGRRGTPDDFISFFLLRDASNRIIGVTITGTIVAPIVYLSKGGECFVAAENRITIDWNILRAEYVAGASYAVLAKKYGLSKSTVYQHGKTDSWKQLREDAVNAARAKTVQKTADAAADNAIIAHRIKNKLLLLLDRKTDELMRETLEGTTIRKGETEHEYDEAGNLTKMTDTQKEHKIRDLTAAYKDLTADMPQQNSKANELLQSLYDLETGK